MAVDRPAYSSSFTLSRFVHRELIVLLILCAAAVAVFLVTKVAAAAARDLRERDARTWYLRGVAHLEASRADEAVEALGHARALDRGEQTYHLAFARALVAAGQSEAARQALLALRETHPEDPIVNEGLAEIEAASGNVSEAVRFYQRALYGSWDPEQRVARTRLRVKMIEYLIAHDMRSRAIGQLLLYADDLPAEAGPRLEAANLLLRAGDPARALSQYRRLLDLDPQNGDAHAGAGRAAFALRDYAAARRYLTRAPPDAEGVIEMRSLASAVLQADPMAARLTDAQRRRRLTAGLAHVSTIIATCLQRPGTAGQTALAGHDAALRAVREGLTTGNVIDAEAFEAAVAAVARAATALPDACGPVDVTTRAWRLIGRTEDERVR